MEKQKQTMELRMMYLQKGSTAVFLRLSPQKMRQTVHPGQSQLTMRF